MEIRDVCSHVFYDEAFLRPICGNFQLFLEFRHKYEERRTINYGQIQLGLDHSMNDEVYLEIYRCVNEMGGGVRDRWNEL